MTNPSRIAPRAPRIVDLIGRFLRGKSGSSAVAKGLMIRTLLLVVNFGTGVIVARSLGPAGRGEQAALILWPSFLGTIAMFGVPTSLTYHSRQQPESAKRFFMGSVIVMFFIGLAASIVGGAFMPILLRTFDGDTIRAAQSLMIFVPVTLLSAAARAHLEARDQFTRSTLGLLYPTLATLGLLAILRLVGHLTPINAALAYVAPPAIQALWLVGRLWQTSAFALREFAPDMRLLLPYGLRCYGADLLITISGQMDLVVIVAFLSPAQLGLYTVAVSLSRLINVVHAAVNTILFSRASAMPPDEAIALVARATRLCTLLCIGLSAIFLLVVRNLLPLVYGASFIAALPLIVILTVEAILGGLQWVLSTAFISTGRPAVITVVQGCWSVIVIGLLFFLVPRMNITGAATALVTASAIRVGMVMAAFPLLLKRKCPNVFFSLSDIDYLVEQIRVHRTTSSAIGSERVLRG